MDFVDFTVLAAGLRFPEGPVVLPDGTIACVELGGGVVTRIAADGTLSQLARTGGSPNGLAIGPAGDLFVCNAGTGVVWPDKIRPGVPYVPLQLHGPDQSAGSIQKIDLISGMVTTLYDGCNGIPLKAPNDLVFDRHGGFYFTDFGKVHGRQRDLGSVYYALADGSHIHEVIHPLHMPNGVGLSPDQTTLYVSETETARLWAFVIGDPGVIIPSAGPARHGGSLVLGLGGYNWFDSLAVDADGNICVATVMGGAISEISPTGELLRSLPFPDRFVTNICFAGPDMRTAFVTLSSRGEVVMLPWPQRGLPLNH